MIGSNQRPKLTLAAVVQKKCDTCTYHILVCVLLLWRRGDHQLCREQEMGSKVLAMSRAAGDACLGRGADQEKAWLEKAAGE